MKVQNVLPRDAISSIDTPEFGERYLGEPDDEVIVIDGNPPRAYPIRILSYHEIVNDVVDGRPVAVTWCPICWSGVVYERTVDGRELTFGVSGKLADDALVMYDRETGSEWKQTLGKCIAGELEGMTLTVLPSSIVTWERFRAEHPDGITLQPANVAASSVNESTFRERYDMERYREYVEDDMFGLRGIRGIGEKRSWDREDLDAKTLVLGVEHGGDAVAYPIPRVEAAGGVVTDTVGEKAIVVFTTDGEIHAFENPGYDFEVTDGLARADGTSWDPTTGRSDDGRKLARIPAKRLFAFAWQDDHGPDSFFSIR